MGKAYKKASMTLQGWKRSVLAFAKNPLCPKSQNDGNDDLDRVCNIFPYASTDLIVRALDPLRTQ